MDLKPHISEKPSSQLEAHYEIERQVQLCVDLCGAIARRILLIEQVAIPDALRQVFLVLGDKKIISKKLAGQLAASVGLRNLIVHEYGILDYALFFGGLPDGYKAFVRFAKKAQSYK